MNSTRILALLIIGAGLLFGVPNAQAAGHRPGPAAGQPLKKTTKAPLTVRVAQPTEAVPAAAVPPGGTPAASAPVLVSGSITDANGLPLAGATVWVVGQLRRMSVTNAEGDFTLALPGRSPVRLSYAAAGYQSEVVLLARPSRLTMPAISLLPEGQQ